MMTKTSPSLRNVHPGCAARQSRNPQGFLLGLCLILAGLSANATILIQRSITIDGNFSDWIQAPNILTNTGQFSEDAQATNCDPNNLQPGDDLDCATVQSNGRDLKKFAFSFDNEYLYMYVERYASQSNVTTWLFYLDLDNSGLMTSSDKVLEVRWQGSNRSTGITLHSYVPSDPDGDPLAVFNPAVNEVTADGYTMPGTVTGGNNLENLTGGSSTGLEMETRVRWDQLIPAATGPFSLGFHISSSRGTNLPSQVEDNMGGPEGAGSGSTLIFTDPFLTKTGPENGVGFSGQAVPFTITLGNNGPDTATGIEVTDRCEDQGFDSFHSATPSVGSYNPANGVWSVASLAPDESATLILRCLIEVEENIELTNSASITALGVADTNPGNNSDSATVTVVQGPELTIMKFSAVTRDPVNGSSQPKRIPGAWVTYTVKVVNTGFGNAQTVEITDLLPGAVTLYTGDFDEGSGTGPVLFTPLNSGLSYDFPDNLELLDGNDDPVTPNGGFDSAVERIRISPQGTFWGKAQSPTSDSLHEFELRFRVQID